MVTRELYKVTMAMLRNLYGFDMNKEFFETYYSVISDGMDNESFKLSVADIMKSFKPTSQVKFPTIGDFFEAINLSGDSRAKDVVSDVKYAVGRFGRYDSVDFGDSKTHQTIKDYGGWIQICNWIPDHWAMREKGFMETYNTKRSDPSHNYLAGIHELNNTGSYPIAPPQKVYLMLKKKPFEVLEYKGDTTKIEYVQPVKDLADKMGLPDYDDKELPF